MFINLLLLLSALSLSSIAGFYSVIGMTAIFASAWWPVVIMTGMLEFSKVVVAAWLHRNWHRTPLLLKSYLTISVIVLMFITSLGIFGFLSKAHIEQTSGIGNNQLFIAQIDQQIKVEQSRIEDSRKVIQQMDDAVNSLLKASTRQSSARNATVAQQAARLRQSQAKDRALLNASIDESNTKIRKFNDQKLKLDQEQLKLEVEVGPIKYIAEMIYGNDPDKDLLEKAVRYVIILIIFVFDPLAILMIIAASMSFSSRKEADHTPRLQEEDISRAEKPMSYRQAVDTIRESDQRNGMAWTDHQPMSNSAANIAVPYPKPTDFSWKKELERDTTRIAEDQGTRTIEPITTGSVRVDEVPEGPVKFEVTEQMPEDDARSSTKIEPDPTGSADSVVSPSIQPVATETQSPDNVEPNLTASKPDELLQKIKQYHSVRLEDARRSIR
jgi:hypothetical protein